MSVAAPVHDGLHGAARYRAVLAVSLSILLSVLDYAVANVALPTIAHSIHTSASNSIWVVNAYQLASVISLLPLAALGDRLGQARICRFGLALFVFASVLCAASRTLPELASARALQGFGGACIMSVNAALLRYIYPASRLGRGIAFNGAVLGLAVGLGPTVAAAVLSVASWQWLFLINLPLGGAALAASFSLPRILPKGGRFDWLSAILLMLAFGALIVGGDSFAHRTAVLVSLGFLAIGGCSLAALISRQGGRNDPMLPVDLLALPPFRMAFLTGLLSFVASNFFLISMPFNLEGILHRSAVTTGLLMTPWPVGTVVMAPLVGRLADRIPAGVLTSAGLCVTASGFLALRLLPAAPTDFDIAWRIGLAGIGFGLCQAPNNRAMLVSAPLGRTGGASGMISVARLLGQTLGAMLVAMVLGLAPRGGTLVCLSLATGTALAAAGLSATRLRKKALLFVNKKATRPRQQKFY